MRRLPVTIKAITNRNPPLVTIRALKSERVMPKKFIAILFCLLNVTVIAAPISTQAPKALTDQVQRLTELLKDSHAVGSPDSIMLQMVKQGAGDNLALVIFTIEGFGGGNNHTQYLAAFNVDTDDAGKRLHFTLIDVIPIAGKGWRGIQTLNAKVSINSTRGEKTISLHALEVTATDAPNFPSKKVTINILLNDGRLSELKKP